jgi:hypothetical protein
LVAAVVVVYPWSEEEVEEGLSVALLAVQLVALWEVRWVARLGFL